MHHYKRNNRSNRLKKLPASFAEVVNTRRTVPRINGSGLDRVRATHPGSLSNPFGPTTVSPN